MRWMMQGMMCGASGGMMGQFVVEARSPGNEE